MDGGPTSPTAPHSLDKWFLRCSHIYMLFGWQDWMPDSASYRWGYYAARMRSAIALTNLHSHDEPTMEFSGYIVGDSSGQMEGGLLQRPMMMVGMGSKLIRYYNFGPLYHFPANAYSDSQNASMLFAEIAQANEMIAEAEHVL